MTFEQKELLLHIDISAEIHRKSEFYANYIEQLAAYQAAGFERCANPPLSQVSSVKRVYVGRIDVKIEKSVETP